MNRYTYKAINLITEFFDSKDVKYRVDKHNDLEIIEAGFAVDCGPTVIVRFISRDNDNDVSIRILRLVTNTPQEKRMRALMACNLLNQKVRFVKFCLDNDGDINVEYDLPINSSDDCVGEMAFEIFVRLMKILDSEYQIFMRALYTDEELQG